MIPGFLRVQISKSYSRAPKYLARAPKGPKSLGRDPEGGPDQPQNVNGATDDFRRAPECW